jgi:RNA polymerase sigma-70 factor (ECF subfamily)
VDVKHEFSFTELAHRIKAGDKSAEDILSRRISPGITQIVIRKTGNFALAQELCQETLIVVLTRLRAQPLDDPERLPAFAAQVARNLLMAERRKERRRRTDADSSVVDEAPDLSEGQEADAQRESAAAAIRTVLQEMKSVRDRTLLVRYYLKDEDKKEICRELGLSEMSFNVILFRARNRFLELLARRGIRGGDLFCWAIL